MVKKEINKNYVCFDEEKALWEFIKLKNLQSEYLQWRDKNCLSSN